MLRELVVVSTFLTLILSFCSGVFTLLKNPKAKTNILWFLMTMAVSVWAVGYILVVLSHAPEQAMQNMRIVYLAATFVPMFFFHFVVSLLLKNKKLKIAILLGYLAAIIFVYFATITDYIVSGVQYMEDFGHYEEVDAPGFYTYLAYFFLLIFSSLFLLIKELLKTNGFRKRQIFFILLASVIAFFGATSNFLSDLTGVYPYGQFVVWVFPILITYGVFMDPIKIKIKF